MAHRYLVVANQTLCGQELLDAIRERMTRGPAEFWVLVPATPATHLINDFSALSGAFPLDVGVLPSAADIRDEGIATAKSRLDSVLTRLREVGATVDGAVGDPNPLVAIEKAVAHQQFDQIILSTLPKIIKAAPPCSRRTASRVARASRASMSTGKARSIRINRLKTGMSNRRLHAM